MIDLVLRRTALVGSVLALGGAAIVSSASCADSEAGAAGDEDASTTIGSQDGGVDASDDAPSDSGPCDAADPSCVTDPISCDEAAWCPVATPLPRESALAAVWGWSKNDVLAVGSGGVVLRWDGTTWTRLPSPSGKSTFFTVWGTGSDDIWLASGTDALFHATSLVDGNPDWKAEPNLTGDPFNTATLFAIWGSGAGDVRVAGGTYNLDTPEGFVPGNQFVRSGAPAPWTGIAGNGIVRGIWGSAATDVWLLVDNSGTNPSEKGATFHGTGKDAESLAWKAVDSQATVGLLGIWGSSAADVWAVGEAGTIRRMTPNARRWAPVASPTNKTLRAIWGSGANDVWAVGDAGTVLHWDGTVWTDSVAAFPAGSKPNLYGVWGTGPDDVWIVGDGVVLRATGKKITGGGS